MLTYFMLRKKKKNERIKTEKEKPQNLVKRSNLNALGHFTNRIPASTRILTLTILQYPMANIVRKLQ